jgi:acid phosphatase (class A)
MRSLPHFAAFFASAFVLGLTLRAATAAEPVFIAPDAIDIERLLPPPPADDSPAGRADLETVLQIQADRTPEQIARIERVARQTVFTFAAPVLGPWFTAENLPRTVKWFEVITAESYAVTLHAKNIWKRPRPYGRDERVQPHPTRSRSLSYPSGHASDAVTWAGILGTLFPEHREALALQVRESMWGRILGGSHFPSDAQAGQILGEVTVARMLQAPTMATALDEMRRECAPFLARSAP